MSLSHIFKSVKLDSMIQTVHQNVHQERMEKVVNKIAIAAYAIMSKDAVIIILQYSLFFHNWMFTKKPLFPFKRIILKYINTLDFYNRSYNRVF